MFIRLCRNACCLNRYVEQCVTMYLTNLVSSSDWRLSLHESEEGSPECIPNTGLIDMERGSIWLLFKYVSVLSGVAKGGRGGATAPPMVPKTVLVKSLNPGRNFRGGRCSEQRVKSNYQTAKTYRWAIRMCLIIRVGFGIWLSMTSHIKSSKCVGQRLNVANCQCSSAMWLTHVLCVAFIDYVRYWCRFIVIIIGLGSRNLVVSCSYL